MEEPSKESSFPDMNFNRVSIVRENEEEEESKEPNENQQPGEQQQVEEEG